MTIVKAISGRKKGNGIEIKYENGKSQLYDLCYFDIDEKELEA